MQTYSLLSQGAYYLGKDAREALTKGLPGEFKYEAKYSGDDWAVYTSTNPKYPKTIVSFRGTDLSDPRDIVSDIFVATGYFPQAPRFTRGVELVNRLKKELPGTMSLTGHSLGGTLAYEVGRKTKVPSISFNRGAGVGESKKLKKLVHKMVDTKVKAAVTANPVAAAEDTLLMWEALLAATDTVDEGGNSVGTVMYTTNGASSVSFDPLSFLGYWYAPADANLKVVPMSQGMLSPHTMSNFLTEESTALFKQMDKLEEYAEKNPKTWRQAWRGVLKEAAPSPGFIKRWEEIFGDDEYIKPIEQRKRMADYAESQAAIKLVSGDQFNALYKDTKDSFFGQLVNPTYNKHFIEDQILKSHFPDVEFNPETRISMRHAIRVKLDQIYRNPDAFDTNATPKKKIKKKIKDLTISAIYNSLQTDNYRGYYYDALVNVKGGKRTSENILNDIIAERHPGRVFTETQKIKMKKIIDAKNVFGYGNKHHAKRLKKDEPLGNYAPRLRAPTGPEANALIDRAEARIAAGGSGVEEALQRGIASLDEYYKQWGNGDEIDDTSRAEAYRDLELLVLHPEPGTKETHSKREYQQDRDAREQARRAPPEGVPRQRWEQGETIPGYAPPGHGQQHSGDRESLSAAHAATQIGRNQEYGDFTMNNAQQAHTGKPTLRPRFGTAGVKDVIPSGKEQLRSDLQFDMFSVVGAGYSEGRDNKLFIRQQQREHNILPVGKEYYPNAWDGPSNYQHPMPWQWQNVKDMQHVKAYIDQTMAEKHHMMMTAIKYGEGTAAGFGRDVPEEPLRVSSSGLPRDIRSPFEPVIHNSHPMRPAVDPAGYLEHKQRGMKRSFSAMRDPFKSEHYRNNNGPILNKRRSLEVVLP